MKSLEIQITNLQISQDEHTLFSGNIFVGFRAYIKSDQLANFIEYFYTK